MQNCEEILTQKFVSNLDPSEHQFLRDAILKSLKKYREPNNIHHKRSLKMYEFLKNTIVTEEPCVFHGLKWIDDSCYVDSVLMCLFAVPNTLFDKLLSSYVGLRRDKVCSVSDQENTIVTNRLIDELKKVQIFIREGHGSDNCTNLRKIFSKCDTLKRFVKTYNDAGEFLTALFSTFSDLNVCLKKLERIRTTNLVTPAEKFYTDDIPNIETSPNQYIENYYLGFVDKHFFEISEFFEKISQEIVVDKERNRTERIITSERIISTPYVVFNIQRLGRGEEFNTKIIIPSEVICAPDDSMLEFTGVVVYRPSHYVCFFSCRKIWYYYDDTQIENQRIRKVGSYHDLFKNHGETITQFGTLYFYAKMFTNMA